MVGSTEPAKEEGFPGEAGPVIPGEEHRGRRGDAPTAGGPGPSATGDAPAGGPCPEPGHSAVGPSGRGDGGGTPGLLPVPSAPMARVTRPPPPRWPSVPEPAAHDRQRPTSFQVAGLTPGPLPATIEEGGSKGPSPHASGGPPAPAPAPADPKVPGPRVWRATPVDAGSAGERASWLGELRCVRALRKWSALWLSRVAQEGPDLTVGSPLRYAGFHVLLCAAMTLAAARKLWTGPGECAGGAGDPRVCSEAGAALLLALAVLHVAGAGAVVAACARTGARALRALAPAACVLWPLLLSLRHAAAFLGGSDWEAQAPSDFLAARVAEALVTPFVTALMFSTGTRLSAGLEAFGAVAGHVASAGLSAAHLWRLGCSACPRAEWLAERGLPAAPRDGRLVAAAAAVLPLGGALHYAYCYVLHGGSAASLGARREGRAPRAGAWAGAALAAGWLAWSASAAVVGLGTASALPAVRAQETLFAGAALFAAVNVLLVRLTSAAGIEARDRLLARMLHASATPRLLRSELLRAAEGPAGDLRSGPPAQRGRSVVADREGPSLRRRGPAGSRGRHHLPLLGQSFRAQSFRAQSFRAQSFRGQSFRGAGVPPGTQGHLSGSTQGPRAGSLAPGPGGTHHGVPTARLPRPAPDAKRGSGSGAGTNPTLRGAVHYSQLGRASVPGNQAGGSRHGVQAAIRRSGQVHASWARPSAPGNVRADASRPSETGVATRRRFTGNGSFDVSGRKSSRFLGASLPGNPGDALRLPGVWSAGEAPPPPALDGAPMAFVEEYPDATLVAVDVPGIAGLLAQHPLLVTALLHDLHKSAEALGRCYPGLRKATLVPSACGVLTVALNAGEPEPLHAPLGVEVARVLYAAVLGAGAWGKLGRVPACRVAVATGPCVAAVLGTDAPSMALCGPVGLLLAAALESTDPGHLAVAESTFGSWLTLVGPGMLEMRQAAGTMREEMRKGTVGVGESRADVFWTPLP